MNGRATVTAPSTLHGVNRLGPPAPVSLLLVLPSGDESGVSGYALRAAAHGKVHGLGQWPPVIPHWPTSSTGPPASSPHREDTGLPPSSGPAATLPESPGRSHWGYHPGHRPSTTPTSPAPSRRGAQAAPGRPAVLPVGAEHRAPPATGIVQWWQSPIWLRPPGSAFHDEFHRCTRPPESPGADVRGATHARLH